MKSVVLEIAEPAAEATVVSADALLLWDLIVSGKLP